MSRKNRSPEEQARRAKIRELLQTSNISSMEDIQNLFKETIAEFMENGLESELDEELGYSKYDYKNKDTDNSRNGHSRKTLRTSFGDVEVSVPRDRKGEFEPQLLKKNQTSISQDIEEKMADLKEVYAAVDENAALDALDHFADRWDDKYPKISQSWRDNWPNLSTYFKFPKEIRRLIYTTNTIEGFNRQLRKVTKAKTVFPTDDSLLKMLYLAMVDITKKWTGRRQDWSKIHAQMAVYYEGRLPD